MNPDSSKLKVRMGSIYRQSTLLLVSNILLMVGGYGFKIYLARTIGASCLGLFALGESLVAFALIGSLWSLDQTVFRFIPQFRAGREIHRVRRLIWASCWHVLFFSLLTAIILVVTRKFWADQVFKSTAFAFVLVFFALMLPARSLSTLMRMIVRGYKEVLRVVIIQTFIAFPVKVALSVLLIAAGWGLTGWLTGEVFAYVISFLLLGWLALHLTPAKARKPILTLRQEPGVYSFAGTMIGRTLLATASANLGTFLLGIFLSTRDVGIYSVAVSMVTLLALLQSAMNGAFAPHIPELFATGRVGEMVEMYHRITRWNLFATLPLFVIYMVLAKAVMGVFGTEFASGAVILSALAVGQLINVGTGPVGFLLTMTGHERAVLYGLAAQLAITAALLVSLLPILGLLGAGVAWSIGTIALYLGLYFYAKKFFPLYLCSADTLRLLISTVVLLGCGILLMELLSARFTTIVMLIAASAILYVLWAIWVFFGLLDQKDKEFVGEAWRGVRGRFSPAMP